MQSVPGVSLGSFRSDRSWWRSEGWTEHRSKRDSYAAARPLQESMPGALLLIEPGTNTVSGVGSAHKARRADDFRPRLEFERWESVAPFDLGEVVKGLPSRLRLKAGQHLRAPLARFTAPTGARLLGWLQLYQPETWQRIVSMQVRLGPEWLRGEASDDVSEVYGQQMDGIKIGAEIAGLDRAQVLGAIEVPPSPEDFARQAAEQRIQLVEDQIIQRDVQVFPEWFRYISPFGSVFEDVETGRRLTVVLANKNQAETVTGADVIYYVEDYDAFTLVQYKRCRPERPHGPPVYRPDAQLEAELVRLDKFTTLPVPAPTIASARLASTFSFVKLCDPLQPLAPELSTGMYLDTTTFGVVCEHGPRGGLRIVYGEVPRYVTNTTFCGLVSQGWIGSAGHQSEAVVGALEEAFRADRRVILASVRLSGPGREPSRTSRSETQRVVASTRRFD